MSRTPQPSSHQTLEPLYVIVFGYPPDKYSVAVEYFKQLGETTDPDPNTEISNCFKIGFKHPAEAMWAVRKNGETVGGSWMVGVKWAVRHSFSLGFQTSDFLLCQDPAQAEHVLGQSIGRTTPYLPTPDVSPPSDPATADPFMGTSRVSNQHSMSGSRSPLSGTPTVGTPIRLVPSTSAFRKPGQGQGQGPKPATGGQQLTTPAVVGTPGTPSKSVLGQFSDLVFGW